MLKNFAFAALPLNILPKTVTSFKVEVGNLPPNILLRHTDVTIMMCLAHVVVTTMPPIITTTIDEVIPATEIDPTPAHAQEAAIITIVKNHMQTLLLLPPRTRL